MALVQVKNTKSEMKISLDQLNGRLKTVEENIK